MHDRIADLRPGQSVSYSSHAPNPIDCGSGVRLRILHVSPLRQAVACTSFVPVSAMVLVPGISGQGFLIASCSCTRHPFGPAIQPAIIISSIPYFSKRCPAVLTVQNHQPIRLINLQNLHVLHRNPLPSHPSRHLLPRIHPTTTALTLSRTSQTPMRQTHTMTRRLPMKSPPLHPSRKPHAPTNSARIHELAFTKPRWRDHFPDPQQSTLIPHLELHQMPLRRHPTPLIVSQQRTRHIARVLPPTAHLHGEIPVPLPRFVRNDLHSV